MPPNLTCTASPDKCWQFTLTTHRRQARAGQGDEGEGDFANFAIRNIGVSPYIDVARLCHSSEGAINLTNFQQQRFTRLISFKYYTHQCWTAEHTRCQMNMGSCSISVDLNQFKIRTKEEEKLRLPHMTHTPTHTQPVSDTRIIYNVPGHTD